MKDIKINKKTPTKIPEKAVVLEPEIFLVKRKTKVLPVILFGLMTTSVMTYIFLISSSIFYAVKTSQYEFQTNHVENTILSSNIDKEFLEHSSNRISYINKDSDTSISLK